MRTCLSLYPCLAALMGCGSGFGLRVETNGTHFELRGTSAVVEFTVENAGDVTVFLARCGDRLMTAVDRWRSEHWEQYTGDGCLAIYPMVPVALAPGERLSGSRPLLESGRYRLRLGNAFATAEQPRWDATSNAFDVR